MNKNVKIVSEVDYSTRFPKLNDDAICNLNKELIDMYLTLYSTYSYIFREYIIEKLNLKEYDNMIKDSKLSFIKVKDEDMDIYQNFTKESLDYLYVRNNVYIEKLSNEEREELIDISTKEKIVIDNNIKSFVEKTYQKVIFEDVLRNGEVITINYGPNSSAYLAPNNALVIGINYDEYDLNGMSDDEWDENHDNQLDMLEKLIKKIETNEQSKLNIPIVCKLYNIYSIQKKTNNIEISILGHK